MRLPGRFFALVIAAGCRAASAQEGSLWSDVSPPLQAKTATVRGVAVHPTDARRLVALVWDNLAAGVMVSDDRGATWRRTASDVPVNAERLLAHPGRPGVVFLQELGASGFDRIAAVTQYAGGRLYRSDDFGESWAMLQGPIDAARPFSLSPFAVDPLAPERILATRRTNEQCHTLDCVIRSIPKDYALIESLDGGRSWRDLPGLPEFDAATSLESVAGPTLAAPRRLFVATRAQGVFISEDSAATWARFATGFIWIHQDPIRHDALYASTESESRELEVLQRSDDGGRTWRRLITVPKALDGPRRPMSLTLDPVRPGRLWLTGAEQGVLVSEDSGEHWRNLGLASFAFNGYAVYQPSLAKGVVSSPADPETVYVLWNDRVMRLDLPRSDVLPVTEFEGPGRYWMSGMEGEALSQRYRVGVEGFVATGAGFYAWRPGRAAAGALGSCRFQGDAARGQHSRFITLAGDECEALKRNADWVLEGENEFYAFAPVAGACAAGLVPVMRLFNGKADVNHRYTTDATLVRTMQAQGWMDEGIVMCASAGGTR